MRRFVYTFQEGDPPRGTVNTPYYVHVYEITPDNLVLVAEKTRCYVSEFQLVMMAMEQHKVLPKEAFERSETGGFKYATAERLKEAGFAHIERVP